MSPTNKSLDGMARYAPLTHVLKILGMYCYGAQYRTDGMDWQFRMESMLLSSFFMEMSDKAQQFWVLLDSRICWPRDDVISNPFFVSSRVVDLLQCCHGYSTQ